MFDYQFRLILIGDSVVGKSSLLKFFTDGKFAEVSVTCVSGISVDGQRPQAALQGLLPTNHSLLPTNSPTYSA